MKGNKDITGLFRDRLGHAEMPIRDGFWEELQSNLSEIQINAMPVVKQKRLAWTPAFYRVAAAASVVLVLGVASAAFWLFSPKEEIKEAFTQVATLNPDGHLKGDIVQESFPSIHQSQPSAQNLGAAYSVNTSYATLTSSEEVEEEESVSVTVSITFTQQVYGNHPQQGTYGQYASSQDGKGYSHRTSQYTHSVDNTTTVGVVEAASKPRNWALKAGVGTSLPKGDYKVPFTAAVSLERRLNKYLAAEAGLQYNYLRGGWNESSGGEEKTLMSKQNIHTLSIPVKLNILLASVKDVDFYATAGGAAEKYIGKGCGGAPIQMSVSAGLGMRCQLNDRVALFAEPSISHHFDADVPKNLRTERPTNLNLLCGVRMTY